MLRLGNDMIGKGPKLQAQTDSEETNAIIENHWRSWFAAISGAEKLRAMRMARVTDGEVFAIMTTNDNLDHQVKLDIKLIEADQCATPTSKTSLNNKVDGIEYDQFGNPTLYYILKSHPGDGMFIPDADTIDAKHVLHYYMVKRVGQSRGIPDIAPALLLFAMLRRFTIAEVKAAELAACYAATVESDAPADGSDEVEVGDSFDLQPGMVQFLPKGWKLNGFDSEHPKANYKDFKREIVSEIVSCLNMPKNIALADSSDYNFASGRLDHLNYWKSLQTDQDHMALKVLNPLFKRWLKEAVLVGLIPNIEVEPTWIWAIAEHAVDPLKEATADQVALQAGTTNLAEIFGAQGKDWREMERQKAIEEANRKALEKEFSLDPRNVIPTQNGQQDQGNQ